MGEENAVACGTYEHWNYPVSSEKLDYLLVKLCYGSCGSQAIKLVEATFHYPLQLLMWSLYENTQLSENIYKVLSHKPAVNKLT